jgi:hypothetical protein
VKTRYFLIFLMLFLPGAAKAQSAQTYCSAESGHSVCNTYNSDGSIKQTYCQDGFGTTVNCNSYKSDGSSAQTQCRNGFGNSVNCNTYNSDGTSKQTDCHGSGNTSNCTSYHSDGSITQTSCHDTFGNTVSCSSTTSGGSSSQTVVTTTPTPPAAPICDANCQNFSNSYAAGAALGVAVGSAIEAHRKHKFCKAHPDGSWKYSNGSVSTCASINGRQEARQIPMDPGVQAERQSSADKAHEYMEELRKDASDIQASYSDAPSAQTVLEQVRSSWSDMKGIYCGYYRGAFYTGLDGSQQICQ